MLRIVGLALALVTLGHSDALAWGCQGHQAIAIAAARLLSPASLQAVKAVLSAAPVDPALRRGCEPVSADLVTDAATWADDERAADPATGAWHFVNWPRSQPSQTASAAQSCAAGQCIVDAITTQFQILKSDSDRARKGKALRFVIHLVGDIHQPLHVITNGDRGGNCVPVAFLALPPEEDERGGFSPNLHGVWDSSLVARVMSAHGLVSAQALADYLAAPGAFARAAPPAAPTRESVTSWAREAHALARSVAYGRLPVPSPMEPATALTLTSCTDNRDVSHRMLALHEQIGEQYERAAEPVIVGQLRLAAMRLASVLTSAFP